MSHNEFDSDDDYGPGCAWVLILLVIIAALIVGGYGVVLLSAVCGLAVAAATFLFLKEMFG